MRYLPDEKQALRERMLSIFCFPSGSIPIQWVLPAVSGQCNGVARSSRVSREWVMQRKARKPRRRGVLKSAVRAVFEKLELRQMLAGVQINEFLADNSNGITDSNGDHSDWIELRNTDAASVNLNGWS